MESVRVEVTTDHAVHIPGQIVKGSVHIVASKPIAVDNIVAHLHGDCVVHFTNKEFHAYVNRRILVRQEKELWHYSTLQEMLGMTTLDHNSNHCEKGWLVGRLEFRFQFKLPYELATSFSCPGSPVVVKYSITVSLNVDRMAVVQHERVLTVVVPQMVARPIRNQKTLCSKWFSLSRDGSLFIECALDQAILSPISKLPAAITIANRWKRSINYVHVNIVRIIQAVGYLQGEPPLSATNTVLINTTGVGLPSPKRKICSGETYSFRPNFTVPALPPNTELPGVMRTAYMLKISVGKAYNHIIATLNVPLSICTDIIDLLPGPPAQREDVLIDLNPSATMTEWAD